MNTIIRLIFNKSLNNNMYISIKYIYISNIYYREYLN